MNLVVDIGNSHIKVACFKDGIIHKTLYKTHRQINTLIKYFYENEFSKSIICSVVKQNNEIVTALKEVSGKLVIFDKNFRSKLINCYKTPDTLGNDRLAMAIGAQLKYPGKNVLIIDAGTCITFDFVSKNSEYLGGSIHPGIEMRFKSLNKYTDSLPLVTFQSDYSSLIGNDTKSSILSGVQTAVIAEVKAMINNYGREFSKVKVILTGGHCTYLADNFKRYIIVDRFFLFKCLHKILLLNAK